MAEPRIQIAIKLTVEQYDRLKRIAKSEDTTMTRILIRGFDHSFDEPVKRKAQATPVKARA